MAGAAPTRSTIVRRRLAAVGAIAAVVVAVWLLLLAGDDELSGRADSRGADVTEIELPSRAVGESQPVTVIVPKDAPEEGVALLVFLHGRGGDEDTELDNEALFATLSELGERAPIVALPDGGDGSYWHDRASGDWARYVTDEVIPALAERFGADRRRVAVGGISMGGFGALNLARLHPGRFCAVGGHSPALWASAGETAPGAFDDAEDFAANNVIGAVDEVPEAFTGQPVWLDIGEDDPFVSGYEAMVAELNEAGALLSDHIWPGGHETAYWREHWPANLRFYARALARC